MFPKTGDASQDQSHAYLTGLQYDRTAEFCDAKQIQTDQAEVSFWNVTAVAR